MGMRESYRRRRKHFIAVSDQQQQIGTPCGESVREAECGEANGLGHACVGVGTEQALDARNEWKSVFLNLADSVAKLGREMSAHRDYAKFHIGAPMQFNQRPVQMAVIGARSCDDCDAALHRCDAPRADRCRRASTVAEGV